MADHPRLVGGRINIKGTYEACLGQPHNELSIPTHKAIKIYLEALTGVSYIHRVWSRSQSRSSHQHITVSRVCPWAAWSVGKSRGAHIPCTGAGTRRLQLPASSLWVKPAVTSSWRSSPTAFTWCHNWCFWALNHSWSSKDLEDDSQWHYRQMHI